MEKLVSFICSVYLDYSGFFFFFLRWGGHISPVFQHVAFNILKIIFLTQA